jgi:SAM-dependent methyltransferase
MTQFSDKRKAVMELIAISFLSLFLELALIRFISSNVQVVAYFNNFLVLSAFLGLGFGSILVGKKSDLFSLFPVTFALLITLISILEKFGAVIDWSQHVLWVGATIGQPNLPAPLVIIFVFCSNFLFFVPLGFRLGQSLKKFENRLVAYAFDLFGSILGVICFFLMSYLQTAPYIWFAISGIIILFLLGKDIKSPMYYLRILCILIGIFIASTNQHGEWSPYYKVSWESYASYTKTPDEFPGYVILVDRLRIQDALRFSETLAHDPELGKWIPYYRLPYHFRKPSKVLVLGGGSGNDATMALRYGAERVDVVEIDPVITNLGYTLHPHKPYKDPKVRPIIDDARSFLRTNQETYDLIVMNALDSHYQLAGLSALRLESFMYTVEAFRDVMKLMNKNSIFLVHLGSLRKWMGERLYWSLTEAFGKEPRLFTTYNSPDSSIAFVYGPEEVLIQDRFPGLDKIISPGPEPFQKIKNNTVLSTDDWPHLYLSKPQIPTIYIYVLAFIVVLTIGAFISVGSTSGMISYLNLFFLGAGFMLLETRSITSIALFFGSTWIVNAIVIGSILIVISIGNALILFNFGIPRKICYIGLFSALAIGYFITPHFLLDFPYLIRVLLSAIWFGMPIFFASLIFSYSFKDVRDTATAFGTNLLGIVVGGVLEYTSMIFGLNSLYLLAIVLYAFAMFSGDFKKILSSASR